MSSKRINSDFILLMKSELRYNYIHLFKKNLAKMKIDFAFYFSKQMEEL